jgi:hypothetical protein
MVLPPLIGLAAGRIGLFVVAPAVGALLVLLAVSVVLLDTRTPPLPS